MIKRRKKAIIISAVSYPVSYVIATILWHVTTRLDGLYPGVVPTAAINISIISLMITFNVIAIICAFAKDEE